MGRLSFDASVKIQANGHWHSTKADRFGNKRSGTGGVIGYIEHVARDVDLENGREVEHSNFNIDSDLTEDNETYYKDLEGSWQLCTDTKQLYGAYKRLYDKVQQNSSKAIRKDAVVLRPVLLQADGVDTDKFIEDSIEWLEDTYGDHNVIGFSVHRDETNVHIHVMIGTATERMERERLLDENGEPVRGKNGKPKYGEPKPTGELTFGQKEVYSGPKALAKMHRDFRAFLIERGHDIELDNKPPEEYLSSYTDANGNVHQKGMTPQELEEVQEIREKLDRDVKANERRSEALSRTEARLNEKEKKLAKREEEQTATDALQEAKSKKISEREAEIRRIADSAGQTLNAAKVLSDNADWKFKKSNSQPSANDIAILDELRRRNVKQKDGTTVTAYDYWLNLSVARQKAEEEDLKQKQKEREAIVEALGKFVKNGKGNAPDLGPQLS